MKSLKSIWDERLYAVCSSSLLFGIFITKKYVVFNLTIFGTSQYDCVIETTEIFDFFPLINK